MLKKAALKQSKKDPLFMSGIKDVEAFWNSNPLFSGEENLDKDNLASFFSKHDEAYYYDVFAGIDFEEIFFLPESSDYTLDLGCGIGFWTNMFVSKFGVSRIVSGDLSEVSLDLAQKRVPTTTTKKLNAENIAFDDETFDFVNCQGVVHHTPNTQACINEIYRVLKPGGRASVSVYYDNILVRLSAVSLPLVKFLATLFLGVRGRGRDFSKIKTKDDLVRFYDGKDNPIGKSYATKDFEKMLKESGFSEIEFRYFFFPFRFLNFPIPSLIKKPFVKILPFMVVANLKK